MELETISHCDLCNNDRLTAIDNDCNICQCNECGYVFDNPRPTLADLVAFYSQPDKFEDWIAEEKSRDGLWLRRLKKLQSSMKTGSLLDVGTGTGQFLFHAKRFYTSVSGTDVSDSAVIAAKNRYGFTVYKGELQTIDFAGSRFDNITLFHVLEHVPSPRSTVEKCRELLTDGGVLVIAVPNDLHSVKAKLKILLKRAGISKFANIGKIGLPRIVLDGSLNEIHLSHFTPAVLSNFLERMGFSVMENSLDPYYAAVGLWKVIHDVHHLTCQVIHGVIGVNIYDTIWVAARKR